MDLEQDQFKQRFNSRYTNGQLIGRGAYGDVFRLFDEELKQYVAIKRIKVDPQDEKSRIDFERETKIMEQVNHPTIVKLIAYSPPTSINPTEALIITEYMVNGSLDSILNQSRSGKSPRGWNNTTKMIVLYGIAFGMRELHNKTVIHRDLKPGNILLDEYFYPKITDFGLSKITRGSETQSTFRGTVSWMAPEIICEDCHYSFPVDVYAFAMILYEVLSEKRPFDGIFICKLMNDVLNGARPDIPSSILSPYTELIQKCWDQHPQNRPTFTQIVEELTNSKYLLPDTNIEQFETYKNYLLSPATMKLSMSGVSPCFEIDDIGQKVSESSLDVFKIIQRSDEGDIESMIQHALIIEEGKILPKDEPKAANIMKIAADAGNGYAQYKYGYYLEKGIGTPIDLDNAVLYYEKSANNNNFEGLDSYARFLLYGNHTKKDEKRAAEYFKKSADAGNFRGLNNYGFLLQKGVGVEPNIEEAKRYYKLAADAGLITAQVNYARLLNSNGNVDEAIKYFELASSSGNIEAKLRLGMIYEKLKNVELAAKYFHQSAGHNNAGADFKYAQCLAFGKGIEKNVSLAAKYYKQSADNGNEYAQYSYGSMLLSGMVIEQNIAEAAYYFKLSSSKHYCPAMLQYGKLLYEGKYIQQDIKKASECLEEALNGGESDAVGTLVKIHSQNQKKVALIYQKGTELHDHNSMLGYGMCLLYGNGIQKSVEDGISLIDRSAQLGNPVASYHMGVLFEEGKLIKKDIQKAIRYFGEAHKSGYAKAYERLMEIQKKLTKIKRTSSSNNV